MYLTFQEEGRLLEFRSEVARVEDFLDILVEGLAQQFDRGRARGLAGVGAVREEDCNKFASRIIASLSTGVSEMGVSQGAQSIAAAVGVHCVVVGVPTKCARALSQVVRLRKQLYCRSADVRAIAEHEFLGKVVGIERVRPEAGMACVAT